MAYLRSFSGYDDPEAPCEDVFYWSIYPSVLNRSDAVMENATLHFDFTGGPVDLEPSEGEGCVTLVFASKADMEDLTCTVSHADTGLTAEAVGAEADVFGDDRVGSSPELTKPWQVKVIVQDKRPQGIDLDPLLLPEAPIAISRGNQAPENEATGDDGEYDEEDLELKKGYKFKVDFPGILPAKCKVTVSKKFLSHDEDDFLPELDDVDAESDGVNEIVVTIDQPGTVVTITFDLGFKQAFIAGEGTGFGYAIALATKYTGPGGSGRMWVFASQYDCTDKTAAEGLDAVEDLNLFVYRAPRTAAAVKAVERGRFNVIETADWDQLLADHGEFDVTLFNNPHPGYGLHMCLVFGLAAGGGLREKNGKYISVHTVGYARPDDAENYTLTPAQLENFRGRDGNGSAEVQRNFVRTYLAYACNFGTARLFNFQTDAPVSIDAGFRYSDNTHIDGAEFPAEEVHYRSNMNTRGLLEHILLSYIANAPRALKVGGKAFINGSAKLRPFMANKNFVNSWPDHALYYAAYDTNFTSQTFHPSLLSKTDFAPQEPPLESAKVYEWTK